MSQDVRYKGELTPIQTKLNETLEDICKRMCLHEGLDNLDSFYESWKEQLLDTFYDRYYINDNKLYHLSYIALDNLYFNVANKRDESIIFDVAFYNGGCSLSEAIDEAIEYMDE